ncbi:type VI secretion system lipoprotein TssJ [Microbulbifer spongiae]|uniref:Type VI secretion system lipoprotein TssJ n=1 Tax=Microbulbifer spongiae TaxID=2944933 RepID=A0ABY9EGR3_9GAMM|nr:type VI secretion system lipoprotein TssJ [Microbulbifer sp. MI-G]WKD50016.1 type VI secretion system lipoprotein TssJ [Microbulbifer sp. MI-G]
MSKNNWFRITLLGFLVVTLAACQTTRRTLNLDTSVELSMDIREDVNPDDDGRASPVVVRIFMLADDRQFAREEFLNLYENAQSRLGKDLLDTVILKEFAPGEQRVEALALTPEVKYIGLLAEFVQYQRADALMVLPIVDHRKNAYQISLADTRIGTPDEIAKRRRDKASVLPRRDTAEGRDKMITISSEDYESMKERLREMESSK